ncbi:MAG TPA: hypothetical protein VGR84_19205 [Candidatus Acidoferrales bacterium]|nr:hypothetical protein [Candidatus Acidoferrales bacterium]
MNSRIRKLAFSLLIWLPVCLFGPAPAAFGQQIQLNLPIHYINPFDPTQPLIHTGCGTSAGTQQEWDNGSGTQVTYVDCAGVLHGSGGAGITGSGTTNIIPLFTAATALGNSALSQTGGNVGASGQFSSPQVNAVGTAPGIVAFFEASGSGTNAISLSFPTAFSPSQTAAPSFNPEGQGGAHYLEAEGAQYAGAVAAENSLSANSVATIWDHVVETFASDPFNTNGVIPRLMLDRANAPWVGPATAMRMPTDSELIGSGRGLKGATTVGTTIRSAVTNFIPTPTVALAAPSAAAGGLANGTYFLTYTCSFDGTTDTAPSPSLSVTVAGGNGTLTGVTPGTGAGACPSPAVFYNLNITAAGGADGTEDFNQQVAIGLGWTISSLGANCAGANVASCQSPPSVNLTGATVVLGNGIPTTGTAQFGTRLERTSIDCNGVANSIAAANLQSEEDAGIFNVDTRRCAGPAALIAEGYQGGFGAANSWIRDVSVNAGTIAAGNVNADNPSVAGILLDGLYFRGLDGFTVTPTSGGTTAGTGTPYGVEAIGANVNTPGTSQGSIVGNGHCELLGNNTATPGDNACVFAKSGFVPFIYNVSYNNPGTGGGAAAREIVSFDGTIEAATVIDARTIAPINLWKDAAFSGFGAPPSGLTNVALYSRGGAATTDCTFAINCGSRITDTPDVANIFSYPSVLANPFPMLVLNNPTLATAGAITQRSPALQFEGHGWNTGGGGADNCVDYQEQTYPLGGSSTVNGALVWTFRIGGTTTPGTACSGSFTEDMRITSPGTLSLGLAGTGLGSINLNGNTSGTISILPQAAAGTYNFNLPATAGTAGQVLTSQGGASVAMTWTNAGAPTVASVDLSGQNASIAATSFPTPYIPGANGFYRFECYIVSTDTPTGATLPSCQANYTDADTSTVEVVTAVTTTGSVSATGATGRGQTTIYAKSGVEIKYSAAGYAAGSGTALTYALHIRLVGPD